LTSDDLKTFEQYKFDKNLSFIQKIPLAPNIKSSSISAETQSEIRSLMGSIVAIQGNSNKTIGTGFFVSKNVILTNRHVVDGTPFISIGTKDSRKFTGKIINSHSDLDLALIQIEGNGPPVSFYSGAALSEGEDVIAIGNPIGLEYSVTKGIVSSIR